MFIGEVLGIYLDIEIFAGSSNARVQTCSKHYSASWTQKCVEQFHSFNSFNVRRYSDARADGFRQNFQYCARIQSVIKIPLMDEVEIRSNGLLHVQRDLCDTHVVIEHVHFLLAANGVTIDVFKCSRNGTNDEGVHKHLLIGSRQIHQT